MWNGKPFQGTDGLRTLVEKMPPTKHEVQSFDCHPIPGASYLPYPPVSFSKHVCRHTAPFSPLGRRRQCNARQGSSRQSPKHAFQNARWSSPRFLPNISACPGSRGTNDKTWGSRQVLHQRRYYEICGVNTGSAFVASRATMGLIGLYIRTDYNTMPS